MILKRILKKIHNRKKIHKNQSKSNKLKNNKSKNNKLKNNKLKNNKPKNNKKNHKFINKPTRLPKYKIINRILSLTSRKN